MGKNMGVKMNWNKTIEDEWNVLFAVSMVSSSLSYASNKFDFGQVSF
jgi:hypothetical protein